MSAHPPSDEDRREYIQCELLSYFFLLDDQLYFALGPVHPMTVIQVSDEQKYR
jgi:hypothetical protein